jgi:23S rRNA (uracil1939-C5)-methyltransferase
MNAGDLVTLRIDKPAAGGRMIARHDGAVVLVMGGIPGEEVEAEVEKVQRNTAWGRTTRVIEPSPDRVAADEDWACGGNVYSHIRYERQLDLKREIIRDAFTRIGHLAPPEDITVAPSRVDGYRMRARFRYADGRLGYFREGSHQLCDPATSHQLLPATLDVLRRLADVLTTAGGRAVHEVELAENCAADQRALHFILHANVDPSRLGALARVDGVGGVSYGAPGARPLVLYGDPTVADTLSVVTDGGSAPVTLARQAHAFFQGNRYLLGTLAAAVAAAVPRGSVLDLYAGVGLFAVTLAAGGERTVVAIEGDRVAAHDLKINTARCERRVDARHQSVEAFLSHARRGAFDTIIVDPPRTGMTKDALTGAIALGAARVVYVSCDVATLGRDARILVDAGYRSSRVAAFDLFPNTAHVESLAIFDRN